MKGVHKVLVLTCRFRYVYQQTSGTFRAHLPNGKGSLVYLGSYKSAKEAAKAVDVASVLLVFLMVTMNVATHPLMHKLFW